MTRQTSAVAGGLILLLVGIGLIAQALTMGSFGFALINLPLVVVGFAVLRRWPWAAGLGALVAFAYAAFWGFVAATPWRQPTPPSGADRPPLDIYSVALAIAFVVALVLLVFSRWRQRDV